MFWSPCCRSTGQPEGGGDPCGVRSASCAESGLTSSCRVRCGNGVPGPPHCQAQGLMRALMGLASRRDSRDGGRGLHTGHTQVPWPACGPSPSLHSFTALSSRARHAPSKGGVHPRGGRLPPLGRAGPSTTCDGPSTTCNGQPRAHSRRSCRSRSRHKRPTHQCPTPHPTCTHRSASCTN